MFDFINQFSRTLLDFVVYLWEITFTPIASFDVPFSELNPLLHTNFTDVHLDVSLLGIFSIGFIGFVIVYGIVKFFTDIIF